MKIVRAVEIVARAVPHLASSNFRCLMLQPLEPKAISLGKTGWIVNRHVTCHLSSSAHETNTC